MKKLLLLILSLSLMITPIIKTNTKVEASGALKSIVVNKTTYIETFYDDFNGKALDSTKWSPGPEWYRQNNYCKWDNDMVWLDGKGHLILSTEYDENGELLCGAVRSRGLFEQAYGYFEISCKLQQVGGFWSAFWLMPINIDMYGEDGGRDGTEIDIYEAFSVSSKQINHAVHYDGYAERHKSTGGAVYADVYDGKFHNFALEWKEDCYIFYIDGKETYRITNQKVDISEIDSYMKISLEAGSWTGKPDANDPPACIEVDYVKAYQSAEKYSFQNTFYGDLDLDLGVGVDDVLLLRRYLVNEKNFALSRKENADVNDDKVIDVRDLLILRQYIAWEINKLPHKTGDISD